MLHCLSVCKPSTPGLPMPSHNDQNRSSMSLTTNNRSFLVTISARALGSLGLGLVSNTSTRSRAMRTMIILDRVSSLYGSVGLCHRPRQMLRRCQRPRPTIDIVVDRPSHTQCQFLRYLPSFPRPYLIPPLPTIPTAPSMFTLPIRQFLNERRHQWNQYSKENYRKCRQKIARPNLIRRLPPPYPTRLILS